MKTKSTENFLIIARLESLIAGLGMNETMMRAEKYINAGVDGIMIHSKLKEPSEVLEFIPKFEELCNKLGRRPYLIAVPTTYNIISDDELINLGVDKGLWEFEPIKEVEVPEIKDYVETDITIDIGEEKVEKTYEDFLAEKEKAKEERKKQIQEEIKLKEEIKQEENADETDNDSDSDSSGDTK